MRQRILGVLIAVTCIVLATAILYGAFASDDPVVRGRSQAVTRTVTKPSPLKPGVYHEKTAEQQYIVETARAVTRADDVAACKARHRRLVEVEHNESPLRDLITCSGGSG